MGLLNFLRPIDKQIADLIKSDFGEGLPEDEFPDIKGLWFGASPAMREALKQSSWKDFLPENSENPEISETQAAEIKKRRYLDLILERTRNLLKQFIEGVKLIEPFVSIREQKTEIYATPVPDKLTVQPSDPCVTAPDIPAAEIKDPDEIPGLTPELAFASADEAINFFRLKLLITGLSYDAPEMSSFLNAATSAIQTAQEAGADVSNLITRLEKMSKIYIKK